MVGLPLLLLAAFATGCDANEPRLPSEPRQPGEGRTSLPAAADRSAAAAAGEQRRGGGAAATGPTLTVISYNVNFALATCVDSSSAPSHSGGTRCRADEDTLKVIDALDADVLLLQETTQAWEKVLRARLAKKFDHVTFHDPTTFIAGGSAVFSRFPIESDHVYPSPIGWFPANRLVLGTPAGKVEVVNVHLRPAISERGSWVEGWFTTGPLRQRELATYLPHLDPSLPTIIAGDFNEQESGVAFGDLEDIGFDSALRATKSEATTWRYDASGIPLKLRIDHVAFEEKAFEVVSAEVIDGGNSDHLPVRVVLRKRS